MTLELKAWRDARKAANAEIDGVAAAIGGTKAMSIKLEDIRVGDKVTLHAKIAQVDPIPGAFLANVGGPVLSIALADIATHTPAPREFVLGDIVTWGTGAISLEFLAARDHLAVMWNDATNRPETEPLANIRHADPAPAPQEAGKERKKIERWVNFYPSGEVFISRSRECADESANYDRIACLHVEGYEGDGL